jgi:hypothetical protein
MKAIETLYKGYRCRSRAEARWMILMDELGIPYEYEPEGFVFADGTKYLPDFYLPKQNAWLEIKGVMENEDEHKIKQLCIESESYVFVGCPDFKLYVYKPEIDTWWKDGEWHYDTSIIKAVKSDADIRECKECHNVYFKEICGAWDCEICGYYDGDCGFSTIINGYFGETYCSKGANALKRARSARFEHGETADTNGLQQVLY